MAGPYSANLCYLLATAVAFGIFVYGLVQVLKKRDDYTGATAEQLKGFGWILVASVVLSLGSSVCNGMFGMPTSNYLGAFRNTIPRL